MKLLLAPCLIRNIYIISIVIVIGLSFQIQFNSVLSELLWITSKYKEIFLLLHWSVSWNFMCSENTTEIAIGIDIVGYVISGTTYDKTKQTLQLELCALSYTFICLWWGTSQMVWKMDWEIFLFKIKPVCVSSDKFPFIGVFDLQNIKIGLHFAIVICLICTLPTARSFIVIAIAHAFFGSKLKSW